MQEHSPSPRLSAVNNLLQAHGLARAPDSSSLTPLASHGTVHRKRPTTTSVLAPFVLISLPWKVSTDDYNLNNLSITMNKNS